MKATRIAASLIAIATVLSSVTAGAAPWRPGPQQVDNTARYTTQIDARLLANRRRIARTLRARHITPAEDAQILRDVDWAEQAIRFRAAMYAAKGNISASDDADVQALAQACSAELGRHYGRLADWRLL